MKYLSSIKIIHQNIFLPNLEFYIFILYFKLIW